jgi:hypothetical protein
MRKFLILSLLLLATMLPASAQRASAVDTSTAIFSPEYRTLTVQLEGNRLAPPILTLDGEDILNIGFDGLGDERQYLRYSIQYCDADWTPSQLVDSEVFDGFNYADIEDYAFSRATITHYVHYSISLPNDDFRFNLSGNYLLKVYPENDPDDILLQARFMVQESAINISGTVSSRTDIDYNAANQQLSLDINTLNTRIRDVNTDLRVVISQNSRLDNEVTLIHPNRTMGSHAIYEHIQPLIFPAGNEYRRMETINNLYPGMGTDHIEYHPPFYHHILNLAHPRAHREYLYDSTQHGRYFVREYNADNSDTEADYVFVFFSLDLLQIPDADVYLDGDFMLRKFNANSRMDYNPSTGRYEKLLLLKQGAYNYQFLVLPSNLDDAQGRIVASNEIEGDHYQTVNEYLIRVYYRAPGDRYDRLLGVGILYSGQ